LNAQLRDAPSNYLPALVVERNFASIARSCVSSHCQASSVASQVPTLPEFLSTQDSYRQSIPLGASAVLDGRTEWARLDVAGLAKARFAAPGSYRLRELVVGDLGALELAPGDYWIEKLTLGPGARLLPSGEGTVRLHLLNDFTLPWQAMINATGFGQPSNPAHILVLARGAVTLDASSTLAGFVYSRGDLIQGYGAQVY